MIDLKALGEYARRSGVLAPNPVQSLAGTQSAEQEALDLTCAWLDCWHEIDPEGRDLLAQHQGFRTTAELEWALLSQGVMLALGWLTRNCDLGQRFEALWRAREAS